MDKINIELPNYSEAVLFIKGLMMKHSITADQALHLMCSVYSIDSNISVTDALSMVNKGLLKGRDFKAVPSKIFEMELPTQLTLDATWESKPIGDELTLDIADRIEKRFTHERLLDTELRKSIALKYFKGDITIARYFLIFRSLFPVNNPEYNKKWNQAFGITYEDGDRWFISKEVISSFSKYYRKYDIGLILETLYHTVKNSINYESGKCFMTKPIKFLDNFEHLQEEIVEVIEDRKKKAKEKPIVTNTTLDV